jgi:hypothetical protein
MPRRPKVRRDPTAFSSRTLAFSTAGSVNQLENDFKTDKAIKDTKVAALETDKAIKDASLVALTTRLDSLESSGSSSGGGSMSSETVNWTNISEINLSGEKITNGDFSQLTTPDTHPTNWILKNGTLDSDQLAIGCVDGLNGAVAIQQMFSSPLAIGTKIIVKIERHDTNTGNVGFSLVKADGNMHGNVVHVPPSPGFVEYTVVGHNMAGIRLDTLHGTRSISSISVFQGAVSGGSVQVYAGGTIEKISGSNGYNAGASSVQAIGGNSDGYVQFQLARAPLRIGLTYSDVDFTDITPFSLVLNYNGSVWVGSTQALTDGSVSVGDFLRIRHYAATNTIEFQKRQSVGDGQDYVTFHTHPTLTNGSDLYVDTSLFNIGSRVNDVTIVR